ncbi:MAG: DUF4214 domain-containing protein [bacterium]
MGSLIRTPKHKLALMLVTAVVMAGGNFSSYFSTHASPANLTGQDGDITPDTSQRGVNGKLVFASNASGNYDIYLSNTEGKNQLQLTSSAADDVDPSWSPDGAKIAFISKRDGNFEIYVMNADGSNQTRLTNTAADEFDPAWAPNGAKIAFSRDSENDLDVFTMNADGGSQTNLTNNTADDAFPTWSPDSSKLAFTSDRSGNTDIFVMNANGSNNVNISNNSANDDFPTWAPNGRSIAFSSDRFGNFDLFLMNTDGSGQTRLTSSVNEETFAAFSPDSARLVYMAGTLVGDLLDVNDIVVMPLNADVKATVLKGVADEIFPDWQPLSVAGQGVNPIDDPRLFVRQHYLDFLNREPDAEGLAFWINQITSCGSDAACIEVRRINVSAAFFLSIEFQETGYIVYRTYKSSYGNLPGAPVPLTFSEFLSDGQQIGQGVVVGQTGWEQVLENNKLAFFADFVTRLRFTIAYPTTLTPAQFVDRLYTNAGVAPSVAERTAAINEFGSTTITTDTTARARVLRRVAQNSALAQQEMNKAFVLMEYFGYLRRNPNDAPDSNFDGYNFWLTKLNQFNGNFVNAEMVKAFNVSGEYRQRFGQ